MRERTNAEIEAALTAYHGADGWDHNDRADMSYALAAADEVAPPDPVVQREQPIPANEMVKELKQLHLSLMSSEDAHYRGDAFARAAICLEALEAENETMKQRLECWLEPRSSNAQARIEALEAEVKRLMGAPERYWEARWRDEHARVEALERDFKSLSDERQRYEDEARAGRSRIEALEAAGKRLAEAVGKYISELDNPVKDLMLKHTYAEQMRSALDAWRAAEKGGG